jgi:AraC family transcriptional regulator of adaptative response / DNA-3-methyladenine glycosylase II
MSENGQPSPAGRGMTEGVTLDHDTCFRALAARDSRFDGVFFVAVESTGIYCRPVCPARTPARHRCVFFTHAAQAERAGYRACLRCRPELAPGDAPVDAIGRLAAAAVARIAEGALEDRSLHDLARELGVSSRHLRRAVQTELGVSPIELSQTGRLALAKRLLHETTLPIARVAFASGFSSVRRFNALFAARFGRPPSALRRDLPPAEAEGALTLRLDHRPPLDWQALLAWMRARAIPGVEVVEGDTYMRTVRIGSHAGWLAVRPAPGDRPRLRAEISASLSGVLMPILAALRRAFDLDARPHAIAQHLAADPRLRASVRSRPGLRVPGAFDGFETTVRALLGQQVSVVAATTLAGRLAAKLGQPIDTPHPGLWLTSPTPDALAAAGGAAISTIGLPLARGGSLATLARAVSDGDVSLHRGAPIETTLAGLRALPGIGEWTAQYVAMRVLGWPDAFPAGDLVLRRALGGVSARDVERIAEAWRPWRAYAAMHLWTMPPKGSRS